MIRRCDRDGSTMSKFEVTSRQAENTSKNQMKIKQEKLKKCVNVAKSGPENIKGVQTWESRGDVCSFSRSAGISVVHRCSGVPG